MDGMIFQRIREEIEKNEEIGILVGAGYDLDSLGAGLSLYLALRSYGKKVSIASPKEAIVQVSSLVGIDKLKTSLEGKDGGDLIVSFPYKEGEIDKVSYTIDNGYLNIVVKGGELGFSFNRDGIKYTRSGSYPRLIFVVGTSRLSDLGSLFNPEEFKDITLINIDNKADNQGFGEITFVSPQFSSVSEQVARLILDLNLDLDQDTAQNLLSGISFATDNFQKQATSSDAFEMAGVLIRKGAVRQRVYAKEEAMLPQFRQNLAPSVQNQVRLSQNQVQFGQSQDRSGQDQLPGEFPGTEPKKQAVRAVKDSFDRKNTTNPPPDWFTPKVYRGSSADIGNQ
ncbi:hypothetical protein M1615_05250 [Patescibacteria group bacterium]|nr:hypothetical protein [Patescibacteria group bacterium]MCL5010019.1 hypothetical protein [Patescibacteria group bacterium]